MDLQHGTRPREISVLVLTEQAAEAIKGIVAEEGTGAGAGLRISGSEDGDDTALDFDVAEGPQEGDEVVTHGGASVFLDAVAAEVLADKTLDVETHGDHFHFSVDEQEDSES
jgi:iron-sulfur cluster assembly protein